MRRKSPPADLEPTLDHADGAFERIGFLQHVLDRIAFLSRRHNETEDLGDRTRLIELRRL